MDNNPFSQSSTDLNLDESVSRYSSDVVRESSTTLDSISENIYDIGSLKISHDSLGISSFGVINPSSVKSILDNNNYSPQKRLMLWHSLCSPEYLDIFSSLGVSDTTTLIHGESLIVYVCCLAHKEGHNLFEISSGLQTLQFTYRVDRFLSSLIKSGCSIKLVFFDIFKNVFDPTFAVSEEDDSFFDGFLYYRQLILCYLKQKEIPYLVFDNWLTDSRFFDYLSDNEPACILLEDGSSFVYVFDTVYELLEQHSEGAVNAENNEKYAEYLSNQIKVDRYCNVVYTLITQSLFNSLSVAYLFDITHNSHDVKAFMSFSSNVHPPSGLHQQSSKLVLEQFGTSDTSETLGLANDLVVDLYHEVCKLVDGRVTLRDVLACNYLREFIRLTSSSDEVDEENVQLFMLTFKCLMLHNYMIENMSLRDRCTKKVDVSSWSFYTELVTATLDFMCCYSNQVFDSLFKMSDESLSHMDRLDGSVSDVFDGNLFSTLMYLLCDHASKHDDQVDESFIPLDEKALTKIDKLYRNFTKDEASRFFPIKMDKLDYLYVGTEGSGGPGDSQDDSDGHGTPESSIGEKERRNAGTLERAASTEHTNHVDAKLANHIAGEGDKTSEGTGASADGSLATDYRYLKEIRNKYLFLNNSFINLYYKFEEKNRHWVKAKPMDKLVMMDKYNWRDPCTISERLESIDFYLNFAMKDDEKDMTNFAIRRNLQHKSKFSFALAKYLGSSNLHHPIVIKLEHHWLHIKYLSLMAYSKTLSSVAQTPKESGRPTKQSKQASKQTKETKSGQKDKLSKAELLKLKNTELQENKKLESDTNTLTRLELKLAQMFNNDKSFADMYTNILENTDGPNRAVDLLTDFKWVKSILSTKSVQLMYIYKLIQKLYNCFSSYRLRIVKNSPNSFRKLLSIVLRLIFVYYNQYHQLMPKEIALYLYMFLYQLNFKKYASNLVKTYNAYQREAVVSDPKPEKTGKKGGKKGASTSVKEEKQEDVSKNVISQKEMDKVHRECAQWDFAIFDDCESNYMLCYMGDLFERTLGSTNDPRVLFRPDAWQKMLLDVVDARESALVVAPTSTGKTYICYYAMEQVLRVDDHGMVIFVAPTNALALQVTYEITARFSNKYYTNPNLALSSIFLEKFHDRKWNASQILVTVPNILEKLLTSMRTNESNFASRLEYIIFDEVHCISDVGLGTFMERCIHLIPCPFLALSATIGNAVQFHKWLTKIATYNNPCAGSSMDGEAPFNKVHFIQFDERYSDLKLEIYSPGTDHVDSIGSKSTREKNKLLPFNPVCCMSYNSLVANGFPNDVYLTPYDCYVMFQALMMTANERGHKIAETFEYLDPRNYFVGCTLITKRQYRYYLETFKIEFTNQINLRNIDAETYQHLLCNINLLSNGANMSEFDGLHKLYPLLQPKEVLSHVTEKRLEKPLVDQDNTQTTSDTINGVGEADLSGQAGVAEGVSEKAVCEGAGPYPISDNTSEGVSVIGNRDNAASDVASVATNADNAGSRMVSRYSSAKTDDVFNFLNDEDGLEYLNETAFYDMLRKLQSSKRLPCLVFILDRNVMEHVLLNVVKLVLRLQWEKFFGTPERTLHTKMQNKARMDKYNMLLKQYEAEKKMRASASKEQREIEGITNNIELELPAEPIDVSQEYDPEFYFYNRRTYANYSDEIEKFISVAATSIKDRKNANLYIEALKRGIGIHHEGFPHKFTMLTETLLRLGFLNVIISSRSLALGINVPCKSVLFCGDNYELTPLMFKQMSGRCGRRGFDLSGHVIFWSISKKRIKQLLHTNLPTLTTNFNNINTSMLLSILSSFYTLIIKSNSAQGGLSLGFLNKKSDDYLDIREELIATSRKLSIEPKLLVQRLSSLLNNSLNHFTSRRSEKDDRTKIVLLVRIVLEILLNCGMVDENGLIRGCYELALLMRDIHPSNILLSRLVQNSTFTKLLERYSALSGSSEEGVDASFHLLEMLVTLVYRKKEMSNVLNLRRLVSANVRNGTNGPSVKGAFRAENATSCQVAYPDTFPLLPYNATLQKHIDYYNQMVLTTTAKYLKPQRVGADSPSDRSGADGHANSTHPSNSTGLVNSLDQTSRPEHASRSEGANSTDHASPSEHANNTDSANSSEHANRLENLFDKYSQRNLYRSESDLSNDHINIGGVVKQVRTCHELSDTLFELTHDLVPTIEGSFCTIVQLDSKFNQVKRLTTTFDNSYICDYFTHGRYSMLRDANGLGQYAWDYLKKFITFLQHFKFVLKTYTSHLSTDDILFKNVRYILDKIEPMFNRI
ncbi:DEAD/DEAH-like helicase [Theileria orientalis strain Shintoku]|uniref:DEAD/DEAH-like helicase n=1 Tax=Theileria orientalis strain Shintoku TaxID=869250 RepID=J4CDD3_THEOR|nr:DEAD/DEAH-like helicase [Theileria orientalis strain Shintoku]BAM40942.1 DEAD/DEAH-like helicase [Theileria orientalis strain Shintoku]|eukprot:XP_009691243.1 DEAD/DEAH-like helicase [Theileria orientalis strain Shintoku]